MPDEVNRLALSVEQIAVMNEVLADAPPKVRATAAKIASREIVPDDDAEEVVDALARAMLADSANFDGDELIGRGVEIDRVIGIVQQMSEHFYD